MTTEPSTGESPQSPIKKFFSKGSNVTAVVLGIVAIAGIILVVAYADRLPTFLGGGVLSDNTTLSMVHDDDNGKVDNGDTFKVDVLFSSDEAVHALGAYVKYDKAVINAISVEHNTSAFEFIIEDGQDGRDPIDNTAGVVSLSLGAPNEGYLGDGDWVARIEFQVVGGQSGDPINIDYITTSGDPKIVQAVTCCNGDEPYNTLDPANATGVELKVAGRECTATQDVFSIYSPDTVVEGRSAFLTFIAGAGEPPTALSTVERVRFVTDAGVEFNLQDVDSRSMELTGGTPLDAAVGEYKIEMIDSKGDVLGTETCLLFEVLAEVGAAVDRVVPNKMEDIATPSAAITFHGTKLSDTTSAALVLSGTDYALTNVVATETTVTGNLPSAALAEDTYDAKVSNGTDDVVMLSAFQVYHKDAPEQPGPPDVSLSNYDNTDNKNLSATWVAADALADTFEIKIESTGGSTLTDWTDVGDVTTWTQTYVGNPDICLLNGNTFNFLARGIGGGFNGIEGSVATPTKIASPNVDCTVTDGKPVTLEDLNMVVFAYCIVPPCTIDNEDINDDGAVESFDLNSVLFKLEI